MPRKVQEVPGEEATRELVDVVSQVAATTCSTKVDKTEYDAHCALIDEKFERFRAEVRGIVQRALLTGLAWVTVLNFGLFGALCAALK
jgi:acyl transferase domain-containing protein